MRMTYPGCMCVAVLALALGSGANVVAAQTGTDPAKAWRAALLEAHAAAATLDPNGEAFAAAAEQFSVRAEREFPLPWDWCLQDVGPDFRPWLSAATGVATAQRASAKALAELGPAGRDLQGEFDRLTKANPRRSGGGTRKRSLGVGPPIESAIPKASCPDAQRRCGEAATPGEMKRWLEFYLRVAERRRELRLQNLRRQYLQWIFTKHCILGGSHYAYTEGQSDAQHERQWEPGAALCRLEWERGEPRVHTLIQDSGGVIRDPDVSWDGRHVLFAWKKSDREDDYHLYEMQVADGSIRQLTQGLGFADYEGVYLPNDDILFNSTRCVQTVDCWWTEVSNLYVCSREGQDSMRMLGAGLRRLTFDQVHDNYPAVMPDGRVIYTRWEYQDRGQLYVQGLFQMNPDGTGQTEFYANNSWFPTSLLHARGIPGTQKVVAIFSGHHTRQVGKLGIVDPARGRQENAGTQLIAPVRDTPADRIDYWGQDGELFQYPYPLSESEFVVACAPLGWARSPTLFKLYWVAAGGRRELLAADSYTSCNQPVPLAARPRPPVRPSVVDYRKTTGTCYLQDIYTGPGLAGISRGTVKKLRVIALDYRAAGIGWNYNAGPAGEALACTPVAIGNGSWDVKTVLGEATVQPDGSAFFTLPARTPVYFQAIDARGHAVQTMRSWLTLQPGEDASCGGCHEPKNSAPPAAAKPALALKAGPRELIPFHGPPRGFSFPREIQPILDRHCTRCHYDARKWEEKLGQTTNLLTSGPQASSRGEGASPLRPAGILLAMEEQKQDALATKAAFSLLGTPVTENLAKRQWSASYLALVRPTGQTQEGNRYLAGTTTDALVNWVGAQSVPTVLSAYFAGAAHSRLLSLLEEGHYGVRLAPDEVERLACWIDLQVPFCGDYEEANQWTSEEQQTYRHFLEKRRRMEELERQNIAAYLASQTSRDPAATASPRSGGRDTFLSPVALALSEAGDKLYVIAATGRQTIVVDRPAAKVSRRIPLPESPSGLTLAPDGRTLYVTAGMPEGQVLVLDSEKGTIRTRIPAGHSPVAPVISADGKTLFVCDRFRSRLTVIDLTTQKTRAELPVGREPVAAALTPSGRLLLVASLLPAGPATDATIAAEVVAVRTSDLTVAARIPLPNGSTAVRGICVAPDGRHAYAVHTLAHFQLPTTQLDRGWMNTSALSIIDVATLRRLNTVLLDDVDRGAANPWGVTCTSDGQWLCVSHAGTHEVSIIDRPGLQRKLDAVAAGRLTSYSLSGPNDVPNDLSFLVDLRRRVRLPGQGPRGIAVAGNTLYAAEYFSNSVAAVDLSRVCTAHQDPTDSMKAVCNAHPTAASAVASIPLGPTPHLTEARRGEILFHDAGICFQQWQSCASCHPDGRADGLNWDLVNDGLGTPKNTKSMVWSDRTPPAMSLGVRETSQTAVRAGLSHIQLVVRPEADASAIDAYLRSLEPLPSPHLAELPPDGAKKQLSAKAQGGKRVYEKAGCHECHAAPLYTSLKPYDVGTGTGRESGAAFDTPTLVESWRTAPYLHDGRAATLAEVLTRFNPEDRHGQTSALTPTEFEELVEYLLSL